VSIHSTLGTDEAGAIFDQSRAYRYALWRDWTPPWRQQPCTVAFVMLNPSTADHEQLDPTVRRCVGFAKRWGYDRLHVVNLFALRSTRPGALSYHHDPIGPDNDLYLQLYARDQADLAIAAWGAQPLAAGSLERVTELLRPRAVRVLGLTKSGEPRHPRYMPADCDHHALADFGPTSSQVEKPEGARA